jgi:hypothetical protein
MPDAHEALLEWQTTLKSVQTMPPEDTTGRLSKLISGLAASQVMWRNIPYGAPPGGPNFKGELFDLDGKRSAAEIIAQGCGGECGSFGKVLADALVKTGCDPDRVYLIDCVGESERKRATNAARRREHPFAPSGHVFLLVQDADNKWQLADSTSRKLDSIPFASPVALRTRLASNRYAKNPIHVIPAGKNKSGKPNFPNLLPDWQIVHGKRVSVGPPEEIFKDLVVFRLQRSIDYPNHDYKQRFEEIVRIAHEP